MLDEEPKNPSPMPVPRRVAPPATPPMPLPAPTPAPAPTPPSESVPVPPRPPKPPKSFRGLAIAGAWITVLLFGLTLLGATFFLGTAIIGAYQSDRDIVRIFITASVIGALTLAIVIVALWRARRRVFVHHALIGLWVGLGLALLMLAVGSMAFIALDIEKSTPDAAVAACSTPLEQLNAAGDAVIPIQTDLGFGTGFSIDDKGTVMTAYHVIEGARDLYVNYTTGRVNMTVISVSPDDDLALLHMETPTEGYFHLSGTYTAGDPILAYGYPGNALTAGPPSISNGIISRTLTTEDLRMTDESFPDGFEIVQTDAAINPGNSGGPLIGACGVVGVINSISDASQLSEYFGVVSEQGIGYAVSAKTAADRFKLPIFTSI